MLKAGLVALALVIAFATSAVGSPAQPGGIAWRDGDVADAFSEARTSGKPVLLYWGARWCPPCARLKATVFQDGAFIAETRNFIPVYLDGDSKGAQAWAQRYAIAGYPTLIVLRADGSEITRLDGLIEPQAASGLLRATSGRQTTALELVAKVCKDPAHLTADEWKILASFTWEDDPEVVSDPAQVVAMLDSLARAAPDKALSRRFALRALIAPTFMARSPTLVPPDAADAVRLPEVLSGILADPAEIRANVQILGGDGGQLVKLVSDARLRARLGAQLMAGLDRASNDPSVPIVDRMMTAQAMIDLERPASGPMPARVLATVRARVAAADAAAQSPMERLSVVSDAASLLDDAGDPQAARRLLEAELPRSATPFYYMSDLSDLAEEAGDTRAALAWARRAADTADGQASRISWAARYTQAVIRLSPKDAAEVERSADAMVDELGRAPDNYNGRVRTAFSGWANALRDWSSRHQGAAVLSRVAARLQPICAGQSDADSRSACTRLLAARQEG